MAQDELTWKERDHLYKMSSVPMLIVFVGLLAYFVYIMRTDPLKTPWDVIVRMGSLFILMPITFLLAFEIFYHRRIKKSIRFHVKRFASRTLIILGEILLLFLLMGVSTTAFSGTFGEWNAALVGILLWLIIFVVIASRFKELLYNLAEPSDL